VRFPALIAVIWLALTSVIAAGHAEKRVALVIGNDRYANLPDHEQLRKAVNDGRAVGTALRQIGFEVISGENLGRAALVDRLDELMRRLSPGDTVLFFFSGHGVALDGVNYILPSDVPDIAAGQEVRLKGAALGEQYIISELAGRGVRVAVVVLDACRTNPFGRSGARGVGGDKGLAPPPQVKGVFSLYAASSGQSARDRLSDDDPSPNSVFSRVLVPLLKRPGLDLRDLAFEVREEVAQIAQAAGYDQRPAYYDETIGGRIYLAGLPPANITQGAVVLPPAVGPLADEVAWGILKETGNAEQLRRFILQFPGSARKRDAEERLKAVEQTNVAVLAPMRPSEPVRPAVAGPRVAKQAQIGSVTLMLPAPEGHCQLTEQQPADARAIKVIGDALAGTQNELLAVSADCGQLEAWRASTVPALDDHAQYQTPIPAKDLYYPRAPSVKQFCANARAQGEKTAAGATPDLNTRLEAAIKGAKYNETSFLGVLAEDDDACYFGQLLKMRTEIGTEKNQVTISATTLVKGKILFYNLYTVYRGPDTVPAALARHQRNVPALLAANGG
jgi:hypothetical protein